MMSMRNGPSRPLLNAAEASRHLQRLPRNIYVTAHVVTPAVLVATDEGPAVEELAGCSAPARCTTTLRAQTTTEISLQYVSVSGREWRSNLLWAPKMYTVRRTDPGVLISCVRHPVAFRNPWKFLPSAALPGCFKSSTSKSVKIDSRRHQYTPILHAVYRDFGRHRDRHRVPASFLRFVQRGICYVRHGPFIRRIDLGNVGNLRQRRLHEGTADFTTAVLI